jgi:hypothetical protein
MAKQATKSVIASQIVKSSSEINASIYAAKKNLKRDDLVSALVFLYKAQEIITKKISTT